ncbi:hypothetical protein C8Q70DRAFT_1059472 [Cubamyces menziesii]|nr:hypothetical protein C8Q70DRAFT_1059472 [Cubamyces menziesii]
MGDTVRITNPLAASKGGPFFVVLGGDEPGVYDRRPTDVACGFNLDILPIVVVCTNIKEAFKVDLLNNEVFAQLPDPEDANDIIEALRLSQTVAGVFANGEKIYAFKVAEETGIYGGFKWKELFHMTKFPKCTQQGCSSFFDVLCYMLDKKDLQAERIPASGRLPTASVASRPVAQGEPFSTRREAVSRGSSPVKRELSPVKREPSPPPTPTRGSHLARSPSPTKILQMQPPSRRPEAITRASSMPGPYLSAHGFPVVSLSPGYNRAAQRQPPLPSYDSYAQESASTRHPTSTNHTL